MKKSVKIGIASGAAVAITLGVAIPLGISLSGSTESGILDQGRKTIVQYADYSRFSTNNDFRVFDQSVQGLTSTNRDYVSVSTPSIFRQRVITNSSVKSNKDGTSELVNNKEEKMEFDSISSVSLDGGTTDLKSFDEFKTKLDSQPSSSFTFKVNPGTHYVNSNGEKSKYEFKAIDLFYGFMRLVYTSEEFRTKGTINNTGEAQGPVMEKEYIDRIKNDEEFYEKGSNKPRRHYNNGNVYLLALYGIDLQKTIDANTNSDASENYDPDKFTMVFKNPQSSNIIYNLFTGGILFFPIPSQKILELNGNYKKFDLPGKFLQMLEYGKSPKKDGKADLSGMLTVARFYWNNNDINPNSDGFILKKNEFSYDDRWNKRKDSIEKLQYLFYDNVDIDTYKQARQKSFLKNNSESILFGEAASDANLLKDVSEAGDYSDRFNSMSGPMRSLYLNPYYMVETTNEAQKLDDKTSQLLFDENTANVQNSSKSMKEYFLGRGKQFRALLNSSVNLYTLGADSESSSKNQTKSGRNFYPNELVWSGNSMQDQWDNHSDERVGLSHGIDSDSNMIDNYKKNSDNWEESYKSTKYDVVKSAWKKFIDDSIAENSNLSATDKFVFPLYDYKASDLQSTIPNKRKNAEDRLLTSLNNLTKDAGVNLEFKKFVPQNDKELNAIDKISSAPAIYLGVGGDYKSALSISQQYFSAYYGPSPFLTILSEAMDNSSSNYEVENFDYTNQNSFDLVAGKSNYKDFFDYLKTVPADKKDKITKEILNKGTMIDWLQHRRHTVDLLDGAHKDVVDAYSQIDAISQQFFYDLYKADNHQRIKDYIRYFDDLSLRNKLAIQYPGYRDLAPLPKTDESVSKKTIYSSKWLKIADLATFSNGNSHNFIDTVVVDSE